MGSLGSDLSPLGPLQSSLVNSPKFNTILIVLSQRWFVQMVVSNLFVTCKWNGYLQKLRKHLLLHVLPCAKVFKSVCSVLIECDGLCCGGRAPFALPLCVCVCSCVVEHVGLWNAGPFSCFPRGGWPEQVEPAEWVPGGRNCKTGIQTMCYGAFVGLRIWDLILILCLNRFYLFSFETFLIAFSWNNSWTTQLVQH